MNSSATRIILACALLFVLLPAACSRTPDEQQVRAAISAAAQAAEAGNAGDFGDYLSADFDGDDGRLDRRALLNMLRVERLRGEHVSVLLGPVSIERRGERLLADFTVTLGGGGRLLPDHLGVYSVQTAWRREEGDWRCYSAHWKRKL